MENRVKKQVKLLQCYLYSVLHFLYMIFIDSYDISLMLVYERTLLFYQDKTLDYDMNINLTNKDIWYK